PDTCNLNDPPRLAQNHVSNSTCRGLDHTTYASLLAACVDSNNNTNNNKNKNSNNNNNNNSNNNKHNNNRHNSTCWLVVSAQAKLTARALQARREIHKRTSTTTVSLFV
ncbi:unnamed protein product, partial [Polarella glacialis]